MCWGNLFMSMCTLGNITVILSTITLNSEYNLGSIGIFVEMEALASGMSTERFRVKC